MKRTQPERVLNALRTAGARGVAQPELLPPSVVGPPILRLAAIVHRLRIAGHDIRAHGKRHGCSVYVLYQPPPTPPAPGPPSEGCEPLDTPLFDAPVEHTALPRGPYDDPDGER